METVKVLSSWMFSLICIRSLDQFAIRCLNKNWRPSVQKTFFFSLLSHPYSLWRITGELHFCLVKYIASAIRLQISVRINSITHVHTEQQSNSQQEDTMNRLLCVFLLHYGARRGTDGGRLPVIQLYKVTELYSTSPQNPTKLLIIPSTLFFSLFS